MRRKMKWPGAIYRQQVRFWCRLLSTHEDDGRVARDADQTAWTMDESSRRSSNCCSVAIRDDSHRKTTGRDTVNRRQAAFAYLSGM